MAAQLLGNVVYLDATAVGAQNFVKRGADKASELDWQNIMVLVLKHLLNCHCNLV